MMTRSYAGWLGAVGLSATLALGCGAAGAGTGERAAEARTPDAEWTQAQLRKLDPELRTRVRRGGGDRIAVKVYFFELPTDSELSDLLLNRLGEQAIGQVAPETLQRIAARGDVERIERLRDVGYEPE